jgi:septum formation protein
LGKIILASASPRRKKLLQQINLSFEVQVSSIKEAFNSSLSAEEIVQQLALRKSRDVAQKNSDALVIGADTLVVFEDEILEKPADRDEAREMLTRLSGNTHQVYTGVALCKVDISNNITNHLTFVEKTNVTFGNLKSKDINAYVAGGSPMDKAGAYGIQDDFGAIFVKRIEGDFYNVVGFPLHAFYNTMNDFAPEYLSHVNVE